MRQQVVGATGIDITKSNLIRVHPFKSAVESFLCASVSVLKNYPANAFARKREMCQASIYL